MQDVRKWNRLGGPIGLAYNPSMSTRPDASGPSFPSERRREEIRAMSIRVVSPLLIASALSAMAPMVPIGAAEGDLPVPRKVSKSEKEWAKVLTHSQFLVTRQKATEAPFS